MEVVAGAGSKVTGVEGTSGGETGAGSEEGGTDTGAVVAEVLDDVGGSGVGVGLG